jgi:hypothetical protein
LALEPSFALRRGLLPRAEVIGITRREVAEIFPAQIDRNASAGPVGQADKRVGVRNVAAFQVLVGGARKAKRFAGWIDEIERRFVLVIFTIHLDAQADLPEIVRAVNPAAVFFFNSSKTYYFTPNAVRKASARFKTWNERYSVTNIFGSYIIFRNTCSRVDARTLNACALPAFRLRALVNVDIESSRG